MEQITNDPRDLAANIPEGDAAALPIGSEQVKKFTEILQRYKAGKARTDARIVASENWWKLRNTVEEEKEAGGEFSGDFKSRSGWLHNVIVSKHADAVEAYPEPNILPREAGDRSEAQMLSAIIPCILEQNEFEHTYSDVTLQKLKTGTGAYKIVWDKSKLNGLGDISITKVNLLNLYWEPGVTDIQESRYFFHAELYDKDILREQYPEAADKIKGENFMSTKFLYDDHVNTENKLTVIDVYYHKYVGGRDTLQFCKYVGDTVLYATENDKKLVTRGLYDHCQFPYQFDPLFPIEGSPLGYGFVDLCRNPMTEIDLLKTSFIKNARVGAIPRYFSRMDSNVNEDELTDLTKSIVHLQGDVSESSLRVVDYKPLDGNYISVLDRTIEELRETSGNTETATGSTGSGVTAASAIAALQEASGKGSRASTKSAYRAFSRIVSMCIELIRQFYDMPRQFRILGEYGAEQFVSYTNKGIKPVHQGNDFGNDMGYRLPVFDIKVSAQKKNVYTKVTQNELALQFFGLGFFNPQMADQALLCLDLMEFDGKDITMQKIAKNGTMAEKLAQYMQLAFSLAERADPDLAAQIAADMAQTLGGIASVGGTNMPQAPTVDSLGGFHGEEHSRVKNARAQSAQASQPQ